MSLSRLVGVNHDESQVNSRSMSYIWPAAKVLIGGVSIAGLAVYIVSLQSSHQPHLPLAASRSTSWLTQVVVRISNEEGRTDIVSPSARRYLRRTCAYVVGGLTITGATMIAVASALRSPYSSNFYQYIDFSILTRLSTQLLLLGGMLISSLIIKRAPSSSSLVRHSAFISFHVFSGISLSPVLVLGPPMLTRAAVYTCSIVAASFGAAAVCKRRTWMMMSTPLVISSVVLTVTGFLDLWVQRRTTSPSRPPSSSSAVRSLSATSRSSASSLAAPSSLLRHFQMYGTLLFFAAFTMWDIQRLITLAEQLAALRRQERAQRQRQQQGEDGEEDQHDEQPRRPPPFRPPTGVASWWRSYWGDDDDDDDDNNNNGEHSHHRQHGVGNRLVQLSSQGVAFNEAEKEGVSSSSSSSPSSSSSSWLSSVDPMSSSMDLYADFINILFTLLDIMTNNDRKK